MPNTQTAATASSTAIPRPLSKRATAIMIMQAQEGKPMADVVELIARANQITPNAARAYYRWIVINKMAPGKIEEHVRAARGPNKPKEVEPVQEVAAEPQRQARTRAENRAKLEQIAAAKAKRAKRAA